MFELIENIETNISTLGPAKVESPIVKKGDIIRHFVEEGERVLVNITQSYVETCLKNHQPFLSFEMAGPRRKIYFDPAKLKCGIVTCGGLCPGINDVIRALVMELYHVYGVKNIYGFKYGLEGFIPKYGHELIELTPAYVASIHELGGTILGTSRGPQNIEEIVDTLERLNIGILFMIGGDGTLRAAEKISQEIKRRELKCSVIGIPKTIDNDIYLVEKSFGFDTAVEKSTEAIRAAHTEAIAAYNGIGVVKLMGRHSGFIAAYATLALREVNFTLIPEVDFDLEGEHGLLEALRRRLKARGHAVIVVAEGAGQKYFADQDLGTDPSGNPRLGDIGKFLVEKIQSYFASLKIPITLKYIDPSYIIRSLPANANDHIYCGFLAQNAVHAGMAGKTEMLVSSWHNTYVHIPIKAAITKRKTIDPNSALWFSVLETTGQPRLKN
ncbi:MAG TPA: ATP-dependent 6-phosphofructokinase [Candidatus Desulfofervidus auxilii]|uniref:ATP-dependent 6-phosphofructokinase n=1 Tax=Desulfofervidus auxilii TaxID=1621989 RepID=A0A7C0Y8S7_DESA2|nr:ATP-dependent 6-phosphofructokinase [Candidatus Desulfofervidus auxilii]